MSTESAYPLTWPLGWARTKYRRSAPFKCTFAGAREGLSEELARLGAVLPVLSTNVELRLDGLPYASRANPPDPGVAVYFTLKKKRIVLACDKWTFVEHNMRAIAKHIEAMRGQDRWGVGSLDQAFTGYAALPQEASQEPWWSVLGFPEEPARGPSAEAIIDAQFRAKVKAAHPDHGGTVETFHRVKSARDAGLSWHRNGAAS